ncbi:hypothetical protein HYG81_18780 [Natrinema zhouii]|nr:hypothetical protein [Natrinema zhouii]UHQ97904.1 hypothetical protein HYG81_18780 [Natrinema zhouii]
MVRNGTKAVPVRKEGALVESLVSELETNRPSERVTGRRWRVIRDE